MFEPPIEENIPMETNNDEDYAYENEGYDNEETTTFTDPTRSSTPYSYDEPTENHPLLSPPSIENQRRQIKRSKISDLYKHMKWEFDNSAELYLDDKFTIKNEKGRNQLYYIKNGKEYSLTKKNGEFRSQKTINTIINPSEQTILAVSKILDETPTMIEMQTMTGEQIIETVHALSRDIAINTDLDMREMLGLDKALTRFKGELVNNASKLTEIDEQIKGTKDELENAQDPQEQKELKARLKELQQERKTRLEIASQNQKQLSSQIARIRDALYDFCKDDLSLREKVKNIFREQGITIIAVITAIGTIISTLVLSLTGGGGSGIPGGKPPNKGKEWVKNKLKALARLLGRLAEQAAKALPGILGSLLSAILNLLKKVALAAANYTWVFLTSVGALVGYEIHQYLNSSKKTR